MRNEPIVKRLFLAQPTKKHSKAMWLTRTIPNTNATKVDFLDVPEIGMDRSHYRFELYHHESIDSTEKLRNIILAQNRTKGYPTGSEWTEIVEQFKGENTDGKA